MEREWNSQSGFSPTMKFWRLSLDFEFVFLKVSCMMCPWGGGRFLLVSGLIMSFPCVEYNSKKLIFKFYTDPSNYLII